MKQNSLTTCLLALALLVACVLGCNRSTAGPEKSDSNENKKVALADVPPADIAGDYAVTGSNENGSPYKGTLAVIKHGDVYQFRWNTGKDYDGVGVPNGNVIAVAFTSGANGKGCGVVSYQLLDDGTLDGKWGYWGVDESGTERATRNGGSGLTGNYDVTGTNPSGAGYKGTMVVDSKGGGYTFTWSNGSTGYGLRRGSKVNVGIGGSRCAFMAYDVKSNGNLDGVWASYGSDHTGKELATRK